MSALMKVPFHGQDLFLVDHDGEPMVPMRPIVEGMGLSWPAQNRKLHDRFESCVAHMATQLPGDAQARETLCLPLRKLPAWMYSVNPNKVDASVKDRIIAYQNECDDALWQYWNQGHAVNPRAQKPAANESVMEFAKLALEHLPHLGQNSKQELLSRASELAYGTRLIPLPRVDEHLMAAGEVGEHLGVSGNKIGRLANAHGLKVPEYGEFRLDKSRHSSKQVESFYYNRAGLDRLKSIIDDIGAA